MLAEDGKSPDDGSEEGSDEDCEEVDVCEDVVVELEEPACGELSSPLVAK
jgi:hypothetical protein